MIIGRGLWIRFCLFFLFFVSCATSANTKISSSLEWRETATDNVFILEPGTRKELISQLSPGLGIAMDSTRGEAELITVASRMHYYRDDIIKDEYHARGNMNYDLIADYLSIFGSGDITEKAVQQTQTQLLSDEMIFADKARQITARGGIKFKNKQKRYFSSNVELSANKIHNESTSIEGSESRRVDAKIENGSQVQRLIWSLAYYDDQREYTRREDENSSRLLATAGYGWQHRRYQLLFSAGEERLPQLIQGQSEMHEGSVTTIQFKALLGKYTLADVLYGERSFGTTYEANLRYSEPNRMNLFVGVAREQIGDVAKLGGSVQKGIWAFALGYDERIEEYRDMEVGRVLPIEAGGTEESLVQNIPSRWDFASTDVGYFLSKRSQAQVSANGLSNAIRLQATNEIRETLPIGVSNELNALSLSWKHQFNPVRQLHMEARYLEQGQAGYSENAVNYLVRFNQRIGKYLSAGLNINHWQREADSQINEANVVMASLRLSR